MDDRKETIATSCDVEQNETKEDTKSRSILNCTFCENNFIASITLQCMHSVCKPCLMKFIEENKEEYAESFALKCLVCNYMTRLEYLSDTQDVKEKIVRLLSPPKAVLTLLDFWEWNQEPDCTPCRNRGKSTSSLYWCFDCVVYLCNECFLFHSSLPILGNHKTYKREETAKITTLLPSARDICNRHGLRINRICKSSGNVCCDTCISCYHIDVCLGEHKDISEISSMVDSKLFALKISIKILLDEISTMMTKFSNDEVMIRDFFQDNLSSLKRMGDTIERNMIEKTDLLLAESYKISNFKLQEIKSNSILLQQKKYALENARRITSVFQSSSGIRSFLERKKVKNTIVEVQTFVAKIKEEEFQDISIYFNTSLQGLFEISNFGILRERQPVYAVSSEIHADASKERFKRISRWTSELNIFEGKENLGLIQRASSEMNLFAGALQQSNKSIIQFGGRTYTLSISVIVENDNSHVTGCDWKSDNEIIIADAPVKGKPEARIYHTKDGTLTQKIPLNHKPYDVTVLPEDRFVMTFPKEEKLLIGSFENPSAKRFVDISINCYGVCYSEKGTTIIAGKEKIVFCDSDFKEAKTLTVQGEDARYVCAYNNNLIFYSDIQNHKVYSIVGNGDNRFTYSASDMKGPAGLILDEEKNVYICEKASRYLHVLNKSGGFLKKFDVGKNPTAISISKDKRKICIIRGGRNTNNVADIYTLN